MSAQLDEILDVDDEENEGEGESRSGHLLEKQQIYQTMGLLGLFRRKPFSNLSVASCQLCLFVYHTQVDGDSCSFQDIKECLGIKEEEFISLMRELGCQLEKSWGGYQLAESNEIEPAFDQSKLKSKKIEDWVLTLTDQCFKKISDIKSYSIYKKI